MIEAPPLSHDGVGDEAAGVPDRADVVVVGASLAGLAMARRLAMEGVRVVVLESRDRVGHGSAARDPGVLSGGLPEHPWRLVNAIGQAKAKRLYELSSRGIDLAAPDGGDAVTHASIDEREVEELRKSADALEALGLRVRRLSATEACEALRGEGFTAGIQVEHELATDVEAIVHRVATDAMQAGARICCGVRVDRLGTDADGATVHTDAAVVQADAVVLAADHRLLDVSPWFTDKLVPFREHALRIPVDTPLPPARAQYGYVTWRTDADGGLRISGCRWATQHLEVYETEEVVVDAVTDKIAAFAARHLGAATAPTHAWARILTATCDGLPILGPIPGDPTTVCCVGFQGFAPALALAAAEEVATGLLTGRSPLPDWLSPQRFF